MGSVFFQHDGFIQRLRDSVVGLDPLGCPTNTVPPLVRLQVDGAVVNGVDREVAGEVDAFKPGIGIRAIAIPGRKPSLVSKGYQMRWIQT